MTMSGRETPMVPNIPKMFNGVKIGKQLLKLIIEMLIREFRES